MDTVFVYLGSLSIKIVKDIIDSGIMIGLTVQSAITNRLKAFPVLIRIILRQFRFTVLDAIPLIFIIGLFFGLVIFSRFFTMLGPYLSDEMLSRIIIVLSFRELAPLFVALMIIGRSASAITVELANLNLNGQITLLEASGFDILHLIVIPRIIAMMISCFALTFIFNLSCFLGGVIIGKAIWGISLSYKVNMILDFITRSDIVALVVKPILFGLVISFNACFYGLNRVEDVNFIPKAATWAIVKATLSCFIVNFLLMGVIAVKI